VSRGGILYAPVEAFTQWRLQVRPDTPVMEYRGFRYYPIPSVPGVKSDLDEATATLNLTVPGGAFAATRLTRELTSVLPRSPVVPAVFVNYDLNFSRTGGPVPTSGLGVLGEAGWSGGWGVLTQTFLVPDVINAPARTPVRLETTFRHDFPEQGYTLSVGDGTFRTGLLGRAAYFGGLQFGTNFGLAPYINRQPIPLVAGQTSAPSTVQLYVNDVLRQSTNVPAGPFTLDNLPTLSGNGDVTVRVRDILGRETLITQPFFVTADLLAAGLNDWSVEAGRLRLDLGNASNHYGDRFVAGMLRRGLTSATTGEARLEYATHRSALGLAAVHAVGADWLTRAAAMASEDDTLGRGQRWLVGFERPTLDTTLAVTLEGNSRGFRSLGEDLQTIPLRRQLAAQASWFGKWGRLGFALAWQQPYDLRTIGTYSLNYSTTLRDNWQFSAYLTSAFGGASGYTLGAVLTIPLDPHTTASTTMQAQQGRGEFYSSATHSTPAATGLAWRAMAGYQGEPKAEAGAYYLSSHGAFSGELSMRRQRTDVRLGAVGGLLWAGNRLMAIPRFEGSAALVDVPGFANIGVGLGAQVAVHTDADGVAFVNRLSPYQKNPIRLNPNDLPISAEIDSIEADAVPPWRSVAKVEFPVRSGAAGLLDIVFDDGKPAPPGAIVQVVGEDRSFYVARKGEAYVSGMKPTDRLQLHWKKKVCDLDVKLPPPRPDEIPRIGPVRCTGVPR
jgi:outer membrane usher protein